MKFSSYFIMMGGTILLLILSALITFVWALRSGQFHHSEKNSRAIFDEDEPEDKITDRFPR